MSYIHQVTPQMTPERLTRLTHVLSALAYKFTFDLMQAEGVVYLKPNDGKPFAKAGSWALKYDTVQVDLKTGQVQYDTDHEHLKVIFDKLVTDGRPSDLLNLVDAGEAIKEQGWSYKWQGDKEILAESPDKVWESR